MKRLLPLAILGLCAFSSPTLAQTLPIPPSGEYVVQQGDTLESISQKFLGASARWNELMAANPAITNPHFIKPGSKIRITAQTINAKRATIQQVFRQVEQMPFPRPWTPASVGGILQPRDGVRTFEKSSSELKFDNDTRMMVSEESVVFLREAAPTPENVSRKAIEIRAGQADLDVKPGRDGPEHRRVPHRRHPGNDTSGQPRAREPRGLGAPTMAAAGSWSSTARARSRRRDARWPIPSGMGIAVTADGRTNGPEALMQAPRPLTPNESQTFDFSNPTFDWEPVPGASSYTVEVCRDPACGQLVDRSVGVRMTRWTPRVLPIGSLYWRVSAVSASGLDSFISAAQKFTIRTYWRRPVDQP